jgi:phosphate-selective porin
MRIANKWAIAAAIVMLAAMTAAAQETGRVYHPNESIKIAVTFQGPDAAKITGVAVNLKLMGRRSANQPGFATEMYAQQITPSAANTFAVSIPIPTNQAAGEYEVNQIQIFVAKPDLTLLYHPPKDFQTKTYRVENVTRFTAPTIKGVR